MKRIEIEFDGKLVGVKLCCPEDADDCPVEDCPVRDPGDVCKYPPHAAGCAITAANALRQFAMIFMGDA